MHGIKGVPQSIFQWGTKNSAVEHTRHINHAELYAKLLPSETRTVSPKGVLYEKARYNSKELQNWRAQQKAKRPSITIYIDSDPKHVYWRPDKAQWRELVMRAADQVRYRNMRWGDVELYANYIQRQKIDLASGAPKAKLLPKIAEAALRDAAARQGDKPAPYKPAKQSVAGNRKLTSTKTETEQQTEGRNTMRSLIAPPAIPPMSEIKPTSVPNERKPARRSSEPSIADLYKENFTK